jgi:hypothetical protein
MTHLLDVDIEGQETFVEVGSDSAWHRLGHLGAKDMSALEGWQTIGSPMVEDRQLVIPELGDSKFKTLVRTDVRPFIEYGVVTKDYKHLRPCDFAVALDRGAAGRTIKTMGLLTTGLMFACYELPDLDIAGESANWWAVAINDMSGSGSNIFMITPVMPVCSNTVVVGLDSAKYLLKVNHDSLMMERMVEEFEKCFAQAEGKQQAVKDELEGLSTCVLTLEDMTVALAAAAPLPKQPRDSEFKAWNETKLKAYEAAIEYVQNRRDLIFKLYAGDMLGYNEYPARRGTAWGLLQAVIQAYEHEIPARNSRDRAQAFLAGIRQTYINAAYKTLTKICR